MGGIPYTMTRKNKSQQRSNNNNSQKNKQRNRNQNKNSRVKTVYVTQNPSPSPSLGSIGGQLGTVAGNFLSKIFGMGSYKLKKNNIYDDMCNDQVPVMHSNSETVVLRHREYITDISSSTAFTQSSYAINPGLDTTFPFLSAIAQNFQEYSFNGLVFEFKSTSANALNSTNTALGTVIMVASYRADAPSFVNKQQMLNEMWSVDCKPAESMVLPVECDPSENPFRVQYVRGTTVPTGQDPKLYDLAKLTIATVGSQAAAVVGELWATYEVVLRKPKLSAGLDLFGDSALYALVTPANANPLGTNRVQISDAIGLSLSNTVITFPVGAQGNFFVCLSYVNGTAVTPVFTTPTLSNASFITISGNNYFGSNGTNAQYTSTWFYITLVNPTVTSTVTFAGMTIPTTPASSNLTVCQVNGTLVST